MAEMNTTEVHVEGACEEAALTVEAARDMLMEAPVSASEAFGDDAHAAEGAAGAESVGDMLEEAGVLDWDSDDSAPARNFDESNVGLGVDIVEVARMEAILGRSPGFAKRVFSQAEQDYCNAKANAATHYALRFAAKEAVVKALGTGFSNGIGVRDIEVERAPSGKPSVRLSGRALEVANERGVRSISISLSYTRTDAVACALAVTEASMRATEKRKDPMEELARQFKETRRILDDL